MRATYITGYGGPEVTRTGELADPVAGEGEALIAVRAAGVNPVEPAMRQGLFAGLFPFAFPQVMGFDVCGDVLEAPAGGRFAVGDRVFSRLSSRTQGAYAQRVAAPVALLAHAPRSVDAAGAASLPTVALTTWQALVERADLKAGERLLIQAGAGGVGSFAIQLAKHMGAHVTATGRAANHAWMRGLGADEVVDYEHERFEDAGPYDVVYDGVCGSLVARGIDSLNPGGRYVGLVRVADARAFEEIGLPPPAAQAASASTRPFVAQAERRGVAFHGPLTRPDAAQLALIAKLVDDGLVRPTVSAIFPLDDVEGAYATLAGARTRGKLVVEVA